MIQTIEGSYIAQIKAINFNTKTKKISTNYSNAMYKISQVSDVEYLVEITSLVSTYNQTLLFFEDSNKNGYTSASSSYGGIDRIFFDTKGNLIHRWSSPIDKDGIISNASIQLEKACIKCK